MASYEREMQEEMTAFILEMLAKQWDRPEYTGPYPTAVREGLLALAEKVRMGFGADGPSSRKNG